MTASVCPVFHALLPNAVGNFFHFKTGFDHYQFFFRSLNTRRSILCLIIHTCLINSRFLAAVLIQLSSCSATWPGTLKPHKHKSHNTPGFPRCRFHLLWYRSNLSICGLLNWFVIVSKHTLSPQTERFVTLACQVSACNQRLGFIIADG